MQINGNQKPSASVTAYIQIDPANPILSFAAEELRFFLANGLRFVGDEHQGLACWHFILQADSFYEKASFSVHTNIQEGRKTIWLQGEDSACVLHAVYTLLEHCGFMFTLSGAAVPQTLDLCRLEDCDIVVRPNVKKRGIRQHINFPMDISSYPLSEALEYIRNLARMRMNHITFHSYTGQWYSSNLPDRTLLAGGFFYNETHSVPDHPVLNAVVRNQDYYCIPEIEPLFEQAEGKSEAAQEWLRQLMKEAANVGMTITLSIELRDDESEENSLRICGDVRNSFPMIDTLELITQECGAGWGSAGLPVNELIELMTSLFGNELREDVLLMSSLNDELWQLPGSLKELHNNIRIASRLSVIWGVEAPGLAIGVYATDPATLKVLATIMSRYVPSGLGLTLLPGHGGRAVVAALQQIGFPEEDWKRCMIYSWIEFDGNMYLQQNPVLGLQELMEFAGDGEGEGGSICGGIAFNHWRNAENTTAASYAASACLEGAIGQREFYERYAAAAGIDERKSYVQAMMCLDAVDDRVRNELPNIGFCYSGWWLNGEELGPAETWSMESLRDIAGQYTGIHRLLERCEQHCSKPFGQDAVRLLLNRTHSTVIHLHAMEKLTEACGFHNEYRENKNSRELQHKAEQLCREASSLIEEYVRLYAEIAPDRGSEGNLISYYHVLPAYVLKVKQAFGLDCGAPSIPIAANDGPPPPAI